MDTTLTAKPRFALSITEVGLIFLLAIAALVLIVTPFLATVSPLENNPSSAIPSLIGLVYLICGGWIFVVYRRQIDGKVFTFFAASTSLFLAGWSDLLTPGLLTPLWTLGLLFATTSLVHLALVLTLPFSQTKSLWFRNVSYGLAFLLWVILLILPLLPQGDTIRPVARVIISIYAGFAVVFFIATIGIRVLRKVQHPSRDPLRLILISAILSFVPPMVRFIGTPFWHNQATFSPIWLISLVIFPVLAAFSIQNQSHLQSDYLASRLTLYGLLTLIIVGGYGLLVTGLGLLFGSAHGVSLWLIQGFVIFCLALAFNPIRNALQSSLDKFFLRSRKVLDEQLQNFTNRQTEQVDMSTLVKSLQLALETSISPTSLHIFLFDPLSEQYVAASGLDGRPTSDLRFSHASPLAARLSENPAPVSLDNLLKQQSLPSTETSRLKMLGSILFVPIPGSHRLAGWLALGKHRSGELYNSRENSFLQSMAQQVSTIIDRARIVATMENRVREMNVLGRVAQGVNITLQMDDIFELIYAQTTQIIPADDFYLLLLHPETGELMDTFHVEDNDRLSEKEQKNIAKDQFLEGEVATSGRSLLVDDYSSEAHNRGMTGQHTGVNAWMAVPLNAGAGCIGVISLGRRGSSNIYSREELNLLQRIADQAAGAIVKARLLSESERRTRQLTTLNEVTRQLTSTLDLEPLLTIILNSATELLNCEAGSLLLVDQQTDELVFRMVTGPAKGNLTGKRLPPGAGVAGKAVKTRQPIIVSDVQSSPDWFKYVDEQTGFITRALLVIPLEVKGNIIGVIEVINKRGSSSFTQEDQNLLSAFASQAGIAIENARLYTMTDQALAARVEELSVMQRIDRELNTSLEITRTLAITLDWSLRQSRATAGLVGQLEGEFLRIAESQGYTNELDTLEGLLPIDHFSIQQAADTGAPIRLNLEGALLTSTRTLAIIPIRREGATIGIIMLESPAPDALDVNTMAFLTRLSDHASIAISNAQLYAAVQSANVAKSEFVSFVSHELKNPMTSIKGYTELLAASAVGPINEAQANFLTTIRSNVERMSTLVSDLNDVTRIEANRMRLDFKAHTLAEVVDETVRSIRKQIEDKFQTLSIQIPSELPPVWADRTRISQVLTNLVSNAYKYTTTGGTIFIGAEACDNQWDPAGAKRVVHLWVQDTGIGIAPEDQKKIFQKFFRSEDPKTREAPGTGLGLNITRSLVELQGGKIWFESEFRIGTTFHITIPVAE